MGFGGGGFPVGVPTCWVVPGATPGAGPDFAGAGLPGAFVAGVAVEAVPGCLVVMEPVPGTASGFAVVVVGGCLVVVGAPSPVVEVVAVLAGGFVLTAPLPGVAALPCGLETAAGGVPATEPAGAAVEPFADGGAF